MPALNVEFRERELEDLRQIAKERGTSMKALVREAAAADIVRDLMSGKADVFGAADRLRS